MIRTFSYRFLCLNTWCLDYGTVFEVVEPLGVLMANQAEVGRIGWGLEGGLYMPRVLACALFPVTNMAGTVARGSGHGEQCLGSSIMMGWGPLKMINDFEMIKSFC